ncbi:MAG: hypothetical protein HFE74_02290 [Firmicutes bacterium]|jgi:LCP family protein required for cell wall assembly|nr:hypothetical protein [Bacillota bacterium]
MDFKEHLQKSNLAKVTFALLTLEIILALYVTIQVSKYIGMIVLLCAIPVILLVGALLILCNIKKTKVALVLEVILMLILIVAMVIVGKVNSVAGAIGQTKQYEVVQIVTLKDSTIQADDDFNSYVLGYTNSDDGAYEKSSEILVENDKKVKESRPYSDTEKLYNDLLSSKTQFMVLTSNTRSDLSVIDEEYEDKIKVIFEKKYELEDVKPKAVDISKEPFTVYLCGADLSSGQDITSTGRGDVNILLTVNPNTKEVNMQVIPRDTFVYIPCRGGSSKLSYSGWWGGVQSSIDSIEDKFDVEINYYAKINFNGLVKLVDALGGVTVNSHYTYTAGQYNFVKGENFVSGEKALMFARARKMLPENELSRGQHQMELIKGIFRKFAENPTYDNSMAVLDALSENFVTNLPEEDFYEAFELVVKLLPALQNMENNTISGTYKWHYDEVRDGYYQYYFYPNDGEIEKVRNRINAVLEG